MKETSIVGTDLSIGYPKTNHSKQKIVYQGLNFELFVGELTCLLGPNGAGKSTLLKTLSALQPSLKGDILLKNKNLKSYNEQQLATLLGLVLTDKTSIGGFRVSELVAMGRYPYTGFLGKLNSHDHELIAQAMDDVCISHKATNYVAELSDGERQKVMIAKVLTQECPIILLDEPTAFLDVTSRIEVMSLLQGLANKKNKTILLSTHDIELSLLLADRLWLLSREKGLFCGTTEDIVLSDAMTNFFERESVVFNKQTGSFIPRQCGDQLVLLTSEGDLRYWSKNLLIRNGYQLTEEAKNALFTVDVLAQDKIECKINGMHYSLKSFDELNNWVKELNKKKDRK